MERRCGLYVKKIRTFPSRCESVPGTEASREVCKESVGAAFTFRRIMTFDDFMENFPPDLERRLEEEARAFEEPDYAPPAGRHGRCADCYCGHRPACPPCECAFHNPF